jgi:hypothetical protein
MIKQKRLVEELEQRREIVSAAITQLTQQAAPHSLGAVTGNPKDRRALDLLTAERAKAEQDFAEVTVALEVARKQLALAEQQESNADTDRRCKAADEISKRVAVHAGLIDEALRSIAEETRMIAEDLKLLGRTGVVNTSITSRLLSQGAFARAACHADVSGILGVESRQAQAEPLRLAVEKSMAVAIKRPAKVTSPVVSLIKDMPRLQKSEQLALMA